MLNIAHPLRRGVRPHIRFGHESSLDVANEANRFIELVCLRALHTRQEHDFVATTRPRFRQRTLKYKARVAALPLAGQGDHVFNYSKRPGATSDVWNNRQHAGRNKRTFDFTNQQMYVVTQ